MIPQNMNKALYALASTIGLILFTSVELIAQNINYPVDQIKFSPESRSPEHSLLTITKAETNITESKWNTFTVRIPGVLLYEPDYIIAGDVTIQSATPPNHLGLSILFTNGKMLYAKSPLKVNASNQFSVPVSKFTRAENAKNKEPVNSADRISAIRVYASFPEKVDSELTLKAFELSSAE